MFYILIALIVASLTGLCFLYKPMLRLIAEKKAKPLLENMLFVDSNLSKTDILVSVHGITNNRFSDDVILDYFYKIKGHQVININKSINFWVKTYLTSPTKIKLNYFEQVRFYKAFLNYPNSNIENSNKKRDLFNSIGQSVESKFTNVGTKASISV